MFGFQQQRGLSQIRIGSAVGVVLVKGRVEVPRQGEGLPISVRGRCKQGPAAPSSTPRSSCFIVLGFGALDTEYGAWGIGVVRVQMQGTGDSVGAVQQADGAVILPETLRPYMKGMQTIEP